jgi:hypothetical protein
MAAYTLSAGRVKSLPTINHLGNFGQAFLSIVTKNDSKIRIFYPFLCSLQAPITIGTNTKPVQCQSLQSASTPTHFLFIVL